MWICKINLPVVEIGEEHDSAKEEGHEHEEAVDHVEHAVLHEHGLERKHGHNECDGDYILIRSTPFAMKKHVSLQSDSFI